MTAIRVNPNGLGSMHASTDMPQSTTPTYLVAMDAFANGGTLMWSNVSTFMLAYKGYVTGDFNNLTASGIYYTSNGMTANKPISGGIWGYVIVIAFSTQVVSQFVLNMGAVYYRAKYGAPLAWGAWKTIVS